MEQTMIETSDGQRIELYLTELCTTSGLERKENSLDSAPLEFRAFQLGINYALSALQLVPHSDLASLLRRSVDALGLGRDVQVPKAYSPEERAQHGGWTDDEIRVVKSGYEREREIFRKYFPGVVEDSE